MRGKLNIMKQKLYHFDANFYSIEISEKFADYAEASKAIYKYYAKLKRIRRNAKYCGISFGIGISNQDGQTATKIDVKNGKRGRPHICVTSKKTKKWHIHCVIYGTHASSFCQEFIEYYRKGNTSGIRKHCLATADHKGADYVPYCYNQCIKWMTHGDFDFSTLYNNLEWKEGTQADSYILSHKKSASEIEKTSPTVDNSAFRTLYVIITTLMSFMYLYPQNISIKKILRKFQSVLYGIGYAWFVMPKSRCGCYTNMGMLTIFDKPKIIDRILKRHGHQFVSGMTAIFRFENNQSA